MLKWRVKINVKSQTENQVKWAKMKTTPNFKGKKCILVNTNLYLIIYMLLEVNLYKPYQ